MLLNRSVCWRILESKPFNSPHLLGFRQLGVGHAEGTEDATSRHLVAFRIHVAAVTGEFLLDFSALEILAESFGFTSDVGNGFDLCHS